MFRIVFILWKPFSAGQTSSNFILGPYLRKLIVKMGIRNFFYLYKNNVFLFVVVIKSLKLEFDIDLQHTSTSNGPFQFKICHPCPHPHPSGYALTNYGFNTFSLCLQAFKETKLSTYAYYDYSVANDNCFEISKCFLSTHFE